MNEKIKAFTLVEAILVLLIIGIIALLTIPQLLIEDPARKGWDTLAQKMAGYLMQTSSSILIYDATLDDFTSLKLEDEKFSIEDADCAQKIAKLYSKYMLSVAGKIDLTNEYFDKEILDYYKVSTGEKIKDAYSGFFYSNDGAILGFRVYGGCDKTEPNTNPPTSKNKYAVNNVCGSVFYDINGYKKPNRLGLDQFILPIGKRGIKYEDN